MTTYTPDPFLGFTLAIVLLFVGKIALMRIGILREYSIPEPVIGGFLCAAAAWDFLELKVPNALRIGQPVVSMRPFVVSRRTIPSPLSVLVPVCWIVLPHQGRSVRGLSIVGPRRIPDSEKVIWPCKMPAVRHFWEIDGEWPCTDNLCANHLQLHHLRRPS